MEIQHETFVIQAWQAWDVDRVKQMEQSEKNSTKIISLPKYHMALTENALEIRLSQNQQANKAKLSSEQLALIRALWKDE